MKIIFVILLSVGAVASAFDVPHLEAKNPGCDPTFHECSDSDGVDS